MAVNTYFGSGKMTAIYKGAVEITKIYHGTNLVYTSFVPPSPPLTEKVYTDFDLDLQVMKIPDNNVYTDFDIVLQGIKNI